MNADSPDVLALQPGFAGYCPDEITGRDPALRPSETKIRVVGPVSSSRFLWPFSAVPSGIPEAASVSSPAESHPKIIHFVGVLRR